MSRLSRREFLMRGGSAIAGSLIAMPLAGRLLLERAEAAPVITPFPGRLADDLAAVVAKLERKFPYASGIYLSQSGISIRRDRNGKRVSEAPFASEGVSLRVFDGTQFHDAAIGATSADALNTAAHDLLADVSVFKSSYRILPLEPRTQSWRTHLDIDPASESLPARLARVDREFDRVNWDDPRVRSARVSTDVYDIRRIFVGGGRRLASATTMVSHAGLMFGFDKGHPGFGFARRVEQGGLEIATLSDAAIERMRKEFVESFTTEPMPAGEYEVVFAPPVTGLLAHESFGHGVEMDQFVKDRAKAREFLNKPVASSIVSLVDDPSIAGARGSYPFDDEGVISAPTRIIENGVFVRPLTDLMSATFLGTERTPNGRTQGWDRKPYARMSNTFVAPGTSEPDEMLASLSNGLYLEGFRNGIEDPQGWGIQFTAATAREYQGGKPTGRIFAPVTVSGYVPEILGNITMVGKDFALEPGTCGKGFKEFIPVTSGGPHIRTKARVS
ncbi:MAG: TldD/PmbA family protein [Candidatus Eiseniibacteriota bacterium]